LSDFIFYHESTKGLSHETIYFIIPVCPDCGLSFNEFDFLRIHKLLVNTNVDELVKSQNYGDIYRAKQKKMSLTTE